MQTGVACAGAATDSVSPAIKTAARCGKRASKVVLLRPFYVVRTLRRQMPHLLSGDEFPSRGRRYRRRLSEGEDDGDGGGWDHHLARRLRHRADDGPGCGLGEGGERLHYWVFGGPWSYDEEPTGEATGVDKQFLDEGIARCGAIVGGRNTYDAAEAWGGKNPFDVPFFVVTHRVEDESEGAGFTFVSGVDAAVEKARAVAGSKDVFIMGGADVIRQALRAGYVEELSISIAPVVLGGGKRLFEASTRIWSSSPCASCNPRSQRT